MKSSRNTVIYTTYNRSHIRDTYTSYADRYDITDPKIKLKYDHTYRVAEFCERIARSLGLSPYDIDLAWTLGMFHDIGRFEQVRRYHTFQDKDSVNHAALSADLLFKEGMVSEYQLPDDAPLDLMEKAVRLHNVFQLPEGLSDREKCFADILRDADRIDILRVNCETPREDIYNLPTEEFLTSEITTEVYAALMNHEMVNRRYSKSGIDFILGHIAFVFGMTFPESLRIIKEQGFLDELLHFRSQNKKTQKQLDEIRSEVESFIEAKTRTA